MNRSMTRGPILVQSQRGLFFRTGRLRRKSAALADLPSNRFPCSIRLFRLLRLRVGQRLFNALVGERRAACDVGRVPRTVGGKMRSLLSRIRRVLRYALHGRSRACGLRPALDNPFRRDRNRQSRTFSLALCRALRPSVSPKEE
jgi:hypothetical protein